ncbi:hypothetical protein D3C78_1761720 [compost metagenome]
MKRWICFLFNDQNAMNFVYSSERLHSSDRYRGYESFCPNKYFNKEDIEWVMESSDNQIHLFRHINHDAIDSAILELMKYNG